MRHLMMLVAAVVLCAGVFAGEGGTLKGTVKYDGEAPAPEKVKMVPLPKEECHHDAPLNEDWIVDPATKGIKWGIVRILDVQAEAPDGSKLPPVKIDQKGCVFTPYVVLIAPGQTVEVLNPEDVGHNFHTTPLDSTNTPTNQMIPKGAPSLLVNKKYFKAPELIKYECNIHPWMVGYIVVHDPRYAAITGPDGTFEIKDVPPGKYKVVITHGTQDKEDTVEIKAGATATLDKTFVKK